MARVDASRASLFGGKSPKRYPPRLANASLTVVEARPDGSVELLFTNHVPPGMPSPAP